MFTLAMWIMLRDRRQRHVNYALVGAGCALILLATAVRPCSPFPALSFVFNSCFCFDR